MLHRTAHSPVWVYARRGLTVTAGLIAAGLLAAGCGSSAPSRTSTTTTTVTTQRLAFVKCMRTNGVPSLPDPGQGAAGESSFLGIPIPASINMQSPTWASAYKTCQGLIASMLSPQGKPPITDAEKSALNKHAQCMRDHGEPNYPDPTFPASGGIYLGQTPNPDTPAFKNAERACGSANG